MPKNDVEGAGVEGGADAGAEGAVDAEGAAVPNVPLPNPGKLVAGCD